MTLGAHFAANKTGQQHAPAAAAAGAAELEEEQQQQHRDNCCSNSKVRKFRTGTTQVAKSVNS